MPFSLLHVYIFKLYIGQCKVFQIPGSLFTSLQIYKFSHLQYIFKEKYIYAIRISSLPQLFYFMQLLPALSIFDTMYSLVRKRF